MGDDYHRRVTSAGGSERGRLLFIGRDDVERLLELDALIDALEDGFRSLSGGAASVPQRTAARSDAGLLGVMPGYVPGLGLEAKLVSVFPGNHELGLPSHQALIALFDESSGAPLAVMDGTYITAIRTAAASALATRMLAGNEARVLAILGAGVQGSAHLEMVPRVRDFHEVRIASRSADHAEALASRSKLARAMRSFEDATRGADVVCCCTDAASPILSRDWLSAGAHVTSVGSNIAGPELDQATVTEASLFVESRAAFAPPPAGSAELAGLDPATARELGEVLNGTAPGRASADEITVYKSMGHAVEDAVAAALVYRQALADGAGIELGL
jgi:alanine dehydrogenase